MSKFISIAILFLSFSVPAGAQSSGACNTQGQPGADVGARINACDTMLGSNSGVIEVPSSDAGPILTQVIIGSGHVLKLGSGTYTNAFDEYVPPFLLKDHSKLIADSWQTKVQPSTNPTNSENQVVADFNSCQANYLGHYGLMCNSRAHTSTDITVEGIHFISAGLGGTSLTGIVALNNCHHCKVANNWFDDILSTHISWIGNSTLGNFGLDDEQAGNVHTGAKDAATSIINAEQLNIHDENYSLHAAGASAFIDIEPNRSTDHANFIHIHHILMDCTNVPTSAAGCFGVTSQNVSPYQGHIHIDHVTIWGNPSGANYLNVAIGIGVGGYPLHAYRDIEIDNNDIYYAAQAGILVAGTDRAWIHDNTVFCSGAISAVGNSLYTVIENNKLITNNATSECPNASTTGRTVDYSGISEQSTGNDFTIVRNNIAGRIWLLGSHSYAVNNTVDGSSASYYVPLGIKSIPGGTLISQLSAPTLYHPGATTGPLTPCNLAFQQWFYIVTAVDASGAEVPSNEIAWYTACAPMGWTNVSGAVSYKIYRGPTAKTEQYIATVGPTIYGFVDLGGQTLGAPVPTANTTGSLVLTPHSRPTSPVPGTCIMDSGNGNLFSCWDGTAWHVLP